MTESKESRFRRVAEARVNKIIKMIRLLGNCSQTGCYAYTAAQVAQIFTTLQNELNSSWERFMHESRKGQRRFTLSDSVPKPEPVGPRLYLSLPDGTALRAAAYGSTDYPAINIERRSAHDDSWDVICFAEFNPERGASGMLCIGAYQSEQDDTTYYEPYDTAERESNDEGNRIPVAEACLGAGEYAHRTNGLDDPAQDRPLSVQP